MSAAGFTETIWHFAGYLHIADVLARTSEIYDGEPPPRPPEDPLIPLRSPDLSPDFDETVSLPVLLAEAASSDPGHLIPRISIPGVAMPQSFVGPVAFADQAPQALVPGGAGTGGAMVVAQARQIDVTYQEGGYETLVAIKQINRMEDRDTLTVQGVRDADGDMVVPPELDTSPMISEMTAQALGETPATLPRQAAGDATGLIAAIQARDVAWRDSGEMPDEGASATAPTGRIVDGVASEAPLPVIGLAEVAPWRAAAEAAPAPTEGQIDSPAPAQGVGTVVETGQNTQINAALIIDANEAAGSLIIGGDYFFSRAIVQVNVLTDADHVDIARADEASPTVRTGQNAVHNVAEFVTHDITVSHQGAANTPRWEVDVFKGDFYDLKLVVQFNGLDDNDRTVQATAGTYFDARTGANGQVNLVEVYGADSYDIIIVGGSYHRADWIFQYNIVLDSDVVKILSADNEDGAGAEVSTGFNSLVNDANITTYDSADFEALGAAQRSLLDGLDQQVAVLVPDDDWQLTGNASGTLRMLYVEGDYYDVNSITQVNVLSDADQSIQASATADSHQGVSSGGNTALNQAQIIDPGTLSTSKYLGGDAYEASILIQANIVSESATVVIHDTSTLAPELAFFAAEQEPDNDCQQPVQPIDSGAASDQFLSQMLS